LGNDFVTAALHIIGKIVVEIMKYKHHKIEKITEKLNIWIIDIYIDTNL